MVEENKSVSNGKSFLAKKAKGFFSRFSRARREDKEEAARGEELVAKHEEKKELDKKLVLAITGQKRSKLPSWPQLKRINRFFSQRESLIVKGALAIIFLTVIFLGINIWFFTLESRPAQGGEYSEGLLGAPKYLNPLLSPANDVDLDITSLIFSGLLRYGKNGMENDLAEKYEISEDQKEYTFTLKQGVKWHDGEALTGDDVLLTFDLIKDPDVGSPLAKTFSGVVADKIDDYTIKFSLKEPFAPFLSTLTFGILPQKYFAEIDPANIKLAEINFKPIGSGAWKFESFKRDKQGNIRSLTLVPFDGYFAGRPYLNRITFKFYSDVSGLEQALLNKNVSAISYLPRTNREKFFGDKDKAKGWDLRLISAAQYSAVFFNPANNPILNDRAVRQALYKATDRQKIVRQVLGDEATVINGPILPEMLGYNPEVKVDYAPSEATTILDQNKWKAFSPNDYIIWQREQEKKNGTIQELSDEQRLAALSGQEYLRKKDDKILEIALTYVDQPEQTAIAELIVADWRKIGVKVDLTPVSMQEVRREVIKPRNYQALIYGEIVGYDPDPYPFWHSSQNTDPGLSLSVFTDRRVDKLLEDGRQTNDNTKREEYYKKLQTILAEEVNAIFLYQPKYPYIVSNKVRGLNVDMIAVPFDRLADLKDRYINVSRLGW